MSGFLVLRSASEWARRFGEEGRRSVLSVGNFDGLHLGHQKILGSVVERARAVGAVAAVVTFDPHPLKVLRPAQAPPLVETLSQRLEGLARLELDAALVQTFDAAFASLSPAEFARTILAGPLRASAVLVGSNFRFGHRQAGNVDLLSRIGRELGFAVEVIEPVRVGGTIVSSTAVRQAVAGGRVDEAATLLGRPFALTGEIRPGTGRGGTLLFPTLNLVPEQELLPQLGVYATETLVAGRLFRSATNVGFRPTFNGSHLTVESHLFDFSERVTEGPLQVRFWRRLREERKFSGPEELRRQIAVDLEQANRLFSGGGPSSILPHGSGLEDK